MYQPDCLHFKHTGGLLAFTEDNKMKKLRERVVVALPRRGKGCEEAGRGVGGARDTAKEADGSVRVARVALGLTCGWRRGLRSWPTGTGAATT